MPDEKQGYEIITARLLSGTYDSNESARNAIKWLLARREALEEAISLFRGERCALVSCDIVWPHHHLVGGPANTK